MFVQIDSNSRSELRAIYDVAGLITEEEARSILKNTGEFVEIVKAQIGKISDS